MSTDLKQDILNAVRKGNCPDYRQNSHACFGCPWGELGETTYVCKNTKYDNDTKSNSDYISPTFEPAPAGGLMGWICPVCGRGLSPYTSSCPCVINREITYGTGTPLPQQGETISHTNYDNLSADTYSNTNEIGYIKNANVYQKRMGRDEV